MVIGFKKQFAPKIISGSKIHTMRSDEKERWKAGIMMHMYVGLRTRNCTHIMNAPCVSTQYFIIHLHARKINVLDKIPLNGNVATDYKVLKSIKTGTREMEEFVINDGFDTEEEFWKWWTPKQESDAVCGKIIHWTNFKY